MFPFNVSHSQEYWRGEKWLAWGAFLLMMIILTATVFFYGLKLYCYSRRYSEQRVVREARCLAFIQARPWLNEGGRVVLGGLFVYLTIREARRRLPSD